MTWPEGNGWIVKRLREKLAPHIRTGSLVFHVSQNSVAVYDVREKVSTNIRAEHVIFASPTYLAKRIVENPPSVDEFQYAPWLVANLTLERLPEQRAGVPIAWDNVIYASESLGYVVATHQSLRTYQPETVLTYYYPLTGSSPATERQRLLETNWQTWVDFILADLSKPHPEIRNIVQNVDIMSKRVQTTASPCIPPEPTIAKLRVAAADCQACDLWKTGTQTVFGEGNSKGRVMLVGEQPGDQEDIQGHPFVGPAGKVLDQALAAAGIDRNETYVTNAVKHFKWEPRGKRRIHKKPNSMEITACKPCRSPKYVACS